MTHSSHSVVRSGSGMTPPLHCATCGVRLTVANGFIELCNPRGGYPEDTMTTTWRYACAECDTSAYAIGFKYLLRDGLDGPAGWLRHLSEKEWANAVSMLAVSDAYEIATAMKADEAWKPKRLADVAAQPQQESPKPVKKKRAKRPADPNDPRLIRPGTRARIMERDGFKCRRCGATADEQKLVVDHVVPVAKGGKADATNLQTLCWACNIGKSDREPHQRDLSVRHE